MIYKFFQNFIKILLSQSNVYLRNSTNIDSLF